MKIEIINNKENSYGRPTEVDYILAKAESPILTFQSYFDEFEKYNELVLFDAEVFKKLLDRSVSSYTNGPVAILYFSNDKKDYIKFKVNDSNKRMYEILCADIDGVKYNAPDLSNDSSIVNFICNARLRNIR